MITGNEAIYPVKYEDGMSEKHLLGMTLKQYYAGLAMMGMYANPDLIYSTKDNDEGYDGIAKMAVGQANALIAALNEDEKKEK